MAEIQEQRYVCKICSKSCVSGKSLGGHMRVHLAVIAASKRAAKEKAEIKIHDDDDDQSNCEEKMINGCDFGDGDQSNSYELRENPKKSWRISDPKRSVSKNWNCCKECGKEFPSLRALSGHMRCHSIKNKEAHQCKKCGKGFDSVKAMFGHMKSHSKKLRTSNDSTDHSLSDLENLCPVRRKRSRIRYKTAPNSAVFEAEEAATCLIMLSRGVNDCLKFEIESSDDDYLYFGGESSCRSGKFSGYDGDVMSDIEKKITTSLSTGYTKAFTEKNVCGFGEDQMKVDGTQVFDDELLSIENEIDVDFVSDNGGFSLHISENSTKSAEFDKDFLITNCGNKVISSGLQKSSSDNEANLETLECFHNKTLDKMQGNNSTVYMNASLLSVGESDSSKLDQFECIDNNIEQGSTSEGAGSLESSKSKEYECPICFKVFSSGQALGGHKRAHYSGITESKNQEVAQVENLLDLNYPVSVDEGNKTDIGINSWWIDRSHEHEALLLTN